MSPHTPWRERLDKAFAWATSHYRQCDVCAERCHVDRLSGQRGRCGLGAEARVYKEYLHLGEEERLVPSHAVFMTGCNMRCGFCTDMAQVRNPEAHGVVVEPEILAQRIATRRSEGAKNVQFVGGLPDVNVRYILEVLRHCPEDTSVVWNTNLWTTEEALSTLRGIVSTWLIDLKFGNDACGRVLGGVSQYHQTVMGLLPLLERSGEVIVRHLLMPGHLECCTKPALTALRASHPSFALNVMTGYLPMGLGAASGPMSHSLSSEEVREGIAFAKQLGFCDLMVDGRDHSTY